MLNSAFLCCFFIFLASTKRNMKKQLITCSINIFILSLTSYTTFNKDYYRQITGDVNVTDVSILLNDTAYHSRTAIKAEHHGKLLKCTLHS